ncbi:MAG: hypothetical protein GFH27_549397n15 [Chloroflexi bacterium AL-W]|nr:hypothetical protein [Chloroflexi bacterium AL-W]
MSELSRLERIAKSLIPRIPRGQNRQYQLEDARNIINDLGLQLSPAALAYLVSNSSRLDGFLMDIYHVEQAIGKKVVTEFATIDEQYQPKVYEEEGKIAFSLTWKGKERVFSEYDWEG